MDDFVEAVFLFAGKCVSFIKEKLKGVLYEEKIISGSSGNLYDACLERLWK